ncbi:histidine kinase [Bacteroidetes bacterium UKL13-3]|jgi:two-component system phosphate regulon sensor histidine kinase PhoR|nr:histidine kinase [Bacteroidetes bacterium UKL13-3]HCP94271.1 two-component sensor histidine kinase [Bacteroidota bacterium]
MIRNPKPATIAFIIAGLLSLFVIGLTWFFDGYDMQQAFYAGLLTLVFSFGLFFYALEYFIYKKIKLIYKTIHSLKTQKYDAKLSNFDWKTDPIMNMNKEVINWARDQKEQMDELKKLAEFRKEFLGNVSHELKTPIFNIQGYIHTLIDGAIDDPDVNIRFLRKAAKSADRLSDLVADLLAISQLESGELIMEPERFDINALVKDIYEQFEVRAKDRGISLIVKEGCNKPFYVMADRYRIRQVLVNLVLNAIKYGNENGITTASYYDMDENILIEIGDNGDGIDQEHLPRIFERFYRVDKSRARESGPGGTGLGLAIVKHIIEAHNQSINVRSQLGQGTTFGFTLKKASGN